MLSQLLRFEEQLLASVARQRASTSPAVNGLIARFSNLGEYGRIWFAVAGLGLIIDGGRRRDWLRAAGDVLAAYGIGLILKNVIRRPRPAPIDGPALITTPTQLSFPSSHATTSFAAAAAFTPLVVRRLGPVAARSLTVAAVVMTVSRVYLGVHYPSDVVAGGLLGDAVGRRRRSR